MSTAQSSGKVEIIKNIYFYLVSFVALMMVVFSFADIINIALKTWVFTKADHYSYSYYKPPACDPIVRTEDSNIKQLSEEECARLEEQYREREIEARIGERERSIVRDISFIVVGIPLFLLHWREIRRRENGK